MPAGQFKGSDADHKELAKFIASYGEGGENNK